MSGFDEGSCVNSWQPAKDCRVHKGVDNDFVSSITADPAEFLFHSVSGYICYVRCQDPAQMVGTEEVTDARVICSPPANF